MTTATHWRGVSLEELMLRIEFCLDNYRECHVYLIDGRWSIGSTMRPDHQDDHVGTWRQVFGVDAHRKQRRDIERRWMSAVISEVEG